MAVRGRRQARNRLIAESGSKLMPAAPTKPSDRDERMFSSSR
jgi:hypothetical protein